MLTFLPTGLLGLVLASLVSAYMSTISTHLNWGSSYVVNDFYKQLINQKASEKELVKVGRFSVCNFDDYKFNYCIITYKCISTF